MSAGTLNSPLVFVFLIFISLYFWEITRNIEKPEQDAWQALLEKIKVFNQNLLIYRKTGIVLVLKLDIDFITLWDDSMQDGSVTIINTIWTM